MKERVRKRVLWWNTTNTLYWHVFYFLEQSRSTRISWAVSRHSRLWVNLSWNQLQY